MASASKDSDVTEEHPEIMASVDRTGAVSRFVIADVSRDDAWIAIIVSEALPLESWR